eukprot:TRINITY_DN46480_c0_g1_i1.p1 TRINITY_DN46480_c0_g1~~TRINITY_DN46480_c0_g1_i1.p1  ORF type:complete len:109 (-),score=1.71 TRINITY_DN46480_c0_g1_i1:182-508(-)
MNRLLRTLLQAVWVAKVESWMASSFSRDENGSPNIQRTQIEKTEYGSNVGTCFYSGPGSSPLHRLQEWVCFHEFHARGPKYPMPHPYIMFYYLYIVYIRITIVDLIWI